MTNEQFEKAIDLRREINILQCDGFYSLGKTDYKKLRESLLSVIVKGAGIEHQFYLEEYPDLRDFMENYLQNIEQKTSERIAELEKEFAEL